MFYIQQIQENDCGYTALKVLLANQFNKEDYLYLTEDESHGPYSFLELVEIAKGYGLILEGVKYESPEYEELPNKPFLALFKYSENYTHLIYVHKVKEKSVEIFDPSKGRKTLSKSEFYSLFEGSALIIDKVEKEIEVEKKLVDIKLSKKIFAAIIQIASLGALVAGMMFIDTESYIFVPIICFSLYVIMQILLEKYLLINMKAVDSLYLSLIEEKPTNTNLILTRIAEYKKSLFIGPIKLVSDLFTVLFLGIIMIINNRNSVLIVCMILLLTVVNLCLVRDAINKKKDNLAIEEKELDLAEDEAEYVRMSINLHDKAYNVVLLERVLKYIAKFLILLSVVITMIISHIVSVPFVIVHAFFAITIFDKLEDVSSFEKDQEKKKVDYMKLINVLKS